MGFKLVTAFPLACRKLLAASSWADRVGCWQCHLLQGIIYTSATAKGIRERCLGGPADAMVRGVAPGLYQALGLAQAMQSLLPTRQAIKVASGQRIQRAGRAVRLFLLALQAP